MFHHLLSCLYQRVFSGDVSQPILTFYYISFVITFMYCVTTLCVVNKPRQLYTGIILFYSISQSCNTGSNQYIKCTDHMSILLIYPQMLVTEKWVSLPYDTQSGFQNYTNICKAIMCIKIFPSTIFMITVNFCYCLHPRSE